MEDNISSSNGYTIETLLRDKLESHIASMKHIENGRLHDMVMRLVEEPLLKIVLRETKGNQVQASSILGINRNTLRKKIRSYNIKNNKFC